VVERHAIVTGAAVTPGDVIVGLASPGLRSNGYTLARDVLAGRADLRDELLRPSVIYAPTMAAMRGAASVHGFAHITGGGLPGNVGRTLPAGCDAVIRRGSWPVPGIFHEIQQAGSISDDEMTQVFNCGIGMVAMVGADEVDAVLAVAGDAHVIGEVVAGTGAVHLR
jgi:phosphoribosylformylglycinamidine cyclo-ligase